MDIDQMYLLQLSLELPWLVCVSLCASITWLQHVPHTMVTAQASACCAEHLGEDASGVAPPRDTGAQLASGVPEVSGPF